MSREGTAPEGPRRVGIWCWNVSTPSTFPQPSFLPMLMILKILIKPIHNILSWQHKAIKYDTSTFKMIYRPWWSKILYTFHQNIQSSNYINRSAAISKQGTGDITEHPLEFVTSNIWPNGGTMGWAISHILRGNRETMLCSSQGYFWIIYNIGHNGHKHGATALAHQNI